MQPLISIVIPIYNAEETLSECIESVINQTMHEIEIILIDDGSKDTSLNICRKYAMEDKRIRIIEKENGGVSSARNEGLRQARAPLIQFVDSDDSLVKTMCQTMYDKMMASRCDFVICSYYERDGDDKRIKEIQYTHIDVHQADDFINLFREYQINQLWNKLYKRELIDNLFEQEINSGEDLLFNIQYINKVQRTEIIAEPLYVYTVGKKNRITEKSFLMLDIVYRVIYQYIDKFEETSKAYEFVDKRYFEEYTYLLKLASLAKLKNLCWEDGRKMAKTICRRNKFKSFFWIVCQLIISFRLEELVIWFYRIRKI